MPATARCARCTASRSHVEARRDRRAARHQRQRQEHADEVRHGHGAPDARHDDARDRRRSARPDAAVDRGDRRPRRRAGAGGPAAVPQADGRGEPAARRLPAEGARRASPQNLAFCYEAFPVLEERRTPARRQHVRRPAADARDRARADVVAAPAAGGRALGRACRRCWCRSTITKIKRAQGAARPDGADGRAELPPGDPHRRPRLHHRARRDRVRGQVAPDRAGQRADQVYLGL